MIAHINDITSNDVERDYDYFIVFKNCEDRSYKISKSVQSKVSNWIIIESSLVRDTIVEEERDRYEDIIVFLKSNQIENYNVIVLDGDTRWDNTELSTLDRDANIGIDMSSFGFYELTDLLFYLLVYKNINNIDVFYTEPGLYNTESYFDYRPKQYDYSISYPQSLISTNPSNTELFVSVIGFEKQLASNIKEEFEASEYYSLNGFPSYYLKAKDISLINNKEYLEDIHQNNRLSSEASNPFLCYNTLLSISKKNNDFMTICPLGSKPMTLGVILFALSHDTCRVVYPSDKSIMSKSVGVGKSYVYSIPGELFLD